MNCRNRTLLSVACGVLAATSMGCGGGSSDSRQNAGSQASFALESSSVADNATDVSRITKLVFSYSMAVDPSSATVANVSMTTASGPVGLGLSVSNRDVMLTPSTPLAPSADYTVTLNNIRPSGASGVSANASINTVIHFKTRATGWSSGTVLSSESLGAFNSAAIVGNPRGDLLVVWLRYEAGNRAIAVRRYTRATGWGSTTLLDNQLPNSSGAFSFAQNYVTPAIADDGTAFVLWHRDYSLSSGTRGPFELWAATADTAGVWSQANKLDNIDSLGESLTTGQGGRALVAFVKAGASSLEMKAKFFDPASGWGTATTFASIAAGVSYPTIKSALNADGSAFIVWSHRSDANRGVLYFSRFDKTNGWMPAATWEDATGYIDAISASVALNGNAIVSWTRAQNSGYETTKYVRAKYLVAGGGWSSPQQIGGGPPPSFCNPAINPYCFVRPYPQPLTSIDSPGNAIVGWQSRDVTTGVASFVSARVNAIGQVIATASIPFPALTMGSGTDYDGPKALRLFASENVLVISAGYSFRGIWTATYSPASGWRESTTAPFNFDQFSQAAIDADGIASAVWTAKRTDPVTGGTVGADITVARYE